MQNILYLCILSTIIPYERRSMQLYWLSDTIGVADQISSEDVLELSSLGVKSIICNRPDRESESDQPDAESIRQASKKLGIEFAFHPVESNFQTEQDASEMAKHLCEATKADHCILSFRRKINRTDWVSRAITIYQSART